MLALNKLNGVETKVALLLESEITLKEISVATGISESILKKLSSGEQSISNAKYETVERLYNYYIDKSDQLSVSNQKPEYLSVKLPKKVRQLIEDIDKAIQDIHLNKQTINIAVKDVYRTGDTDGIVLNKKELEVDEYIGLGLNEIEKSCREPYELVIKTPISEDIHHITDFKIQFDKQKLIDTLKQMKHEGGSISINKSGYHDVKHIAVQPKNTTIPKYVRYGYIGNIESEFMSIEVKA